jgi:hypothetical protein
MIAVVRELALSRIPAAAREGALEILAHPKTSTSEKRSLLLSKGLLRSVTDELQVLNETGVHSRPQSRHDCTERRLAQRKTWTVSPPKLKDHVQHWHLRSFLVWMRLGKSRRICTF